MNPVSPNLTYSNRPFRDIPFSFFSPVPFRAAAAMWCDISKRWSCDVVHPSEGSHHLEIGTALMRQMETCAPHLPNRVRQLTSRCPCDQVPPKFSQVLCPGCPEPRDFPERTADERLVEPSSTLVFTTPDWNNGENNTVVLI